MQAHSELKLMEDGVPLKSFLPHMASANIYLGTGVVVRASANSAHLVITRCVADPLLLEPIQDASVTPPNECTARAQPLLTEWCVQVVGFQEKFGQPGWDAVEALVPASELLDPIIELLSPTMSLGSYVQQFEHLAEAARQQA